jgi:hypothetical protein
MSASAFSGIENISEITESKKACRCNGLAYYSGGGLWAKTVNNGNERKEASAVGGEENAWQTQTVHQPPLPLTNNESQKQEPSSWYDVSKLKADLQKAKAISDDAHWKVHSQQKTQISTRTKLRKTLACGW